MKTALYLKGHSKSRLDKAEATIKRAEMRKHPHIRLVEAGMFWVTLVTGILGSALLSVASIPILVAGTVAQGYFVIFIFGVLLGALIAYISKNMHWLESHHHLSLAFVIPIIALFNFFIVGLVVNQFNSFAGMQSQHNPVLLGVAYFFGFLVPIAILGFVKGVGK